MISRRAAPEEQPALQALWQRVFGDGPEVTEAFFRFFPPEVHTRVIGAPGQIKGDSACAAELPGP